MSKGNNNKYDLLSHKFFHALFKLVHRKLLSLYFFTIVLHIVLKNLAKRAMSSNYIKKERLFIFKHANI